MLLNRGKYYLNQTKSKEFYKYSNNSSNMSCTCTSSVANDLQFNQSINQLVISIIAIILILSSMYMDITNYKVTHKVIPNHAVMSLEVNQSFLQHTMQLFPCLLFNIKPASQILDRQVTSCSPDGNSKPVKLVSHKCMPSYVMRKSYIHFAFVCENKGVDICYVLQVLGCNITVLNIIITTGF